MQPVSWYINRLLLMSPAELLWRLEQKVFNRFAEARTRIGASETAGEMSLPPWPAPAAAVPEEYLRAAEEVLAGRFDLFGRPVHVGFPDVVWHRDPVSGRVAPLQRGDAIDYRDPSLVGSARNIWEINRHFQLVTLAQAWALVREERYRDGARQLLDSWLRSCPCPMGVNWTSALESGIRLINWYIAGRMLGCWEEGRELVSGWLDSIHGHCKFIWQRQSRFSSANNHLIGEMAGLYCASSAWPCWRESKRWRIEAKRILEREAGAQTHADGVTREQATGYQMFVLQLLIIAGLVGETHRDPFSPLYWATIGRMMLAIRSMADSGGHLPAWGDSDDGMAFMLSPQARARRLEDLAGIELSSVKRDAAVTDAASAGWLASGFFFPDSWRAEPHRRARAFPDAGYYVLGERLGAAREVMLVFDAGSLGYLSLAAHGHADCLSFVLSLGGEPVLIDPGTCCYHEDPVWRGYFRGTSAHNTLTVDGRDQSDPGGAFMWLRKARAVVEGRQIEGPVQFVRARHDGFQRLTDPVVHARELKYSAAGARVEIIDSISARASHRIERFWHFAPGCIVRPRGLGVVTIDLPHVQVKLECTDAEKLLPLHGSHAPRGGWASPCFGTRVPTTTLVCRNRIDGSAKLRTSFSWRFRDS